MSLVNKIKDIFTSPDSPEASEVENEPMPNESMLPPRDEHKVESKPETEQEAVTPVIREVIQAPVISQEELPENSDEILIKAQSSQSGDNCAFRVNRKLLNGFSWYFSSFESAEGSPLAQLLYSKDEVESILVLESHLIVTRKDKTLYDWKEFAKEIGSAIRTAIGENGDQLISAKIIESMPSEEEIRTGIQKSIDDEVNPGVAGHGGLISLLKVNGNSITIHMGGGCQGCSAADLTLKQGIHTTFRKAVPQVGAILDETDHSAGLNPYFS